MRLNVDEVRWWLNNANPNGMGWMLTNDFPVDETTKVSLDRWLAMQQFFAWREAFPPSDKTAILFASDLLNNTQTSEDIIKVLTQLTGWKEADLRILLDHFNWKDEGTSSTNLRSQLTKPTNLIRLTQCMEALRRLGAGADQAFSWARIDPGPEDADKLKRAVIAKYDQKQWQQIIQPIHDQFREQKRQALVDWLVTHPVQEDNQNWSDANGLYSYFLLDVEMSACQLTSRLVQASASVQLFVQRCFMGLEPFVTVQADGPDGDSAWRWWKWMRKYRVWEANRKVFLWPENWIEPELKRDRSAFFKDMENQLLQNEINQNTVEDAFRSYLDKLHSVAQLDIVNFYHEDDGDETIVHVFGRTPGAEPHAYYYRRFDYRQWTPWEKMELDIQGEYLIPVVVNNRLFLYWPIFTEVADGVDNNSVPIPNERRPGPFHVQQTSKRLRVQLAVSEYRQGKWTPKRVSKDFDENRGVNYGTKENPNIIYSYNASDLLHDLYFFLPVDRSEIDGPVYLAYIGVSRPNPGRAEDPSRNEPIRMDPDLKVPFCFGTFDIASCDGVAETANFPTDFSAVMSPQLGSTSLSFQHFVELQNRKDDDPKTDFSLVVKATPEVPNGPSLIPVLMQTPGIFRMAPPLCFSYFDKLRLNELTQSFVYGSWLPFFYNDKKRTFFTLPVYRFRHTDEKIYRQYYPETKSFARQQVLDLEHQAVAWVESQNVANWPERLKGVWEVFLSGLFPEDVAAPYNLQQPNELEQFKHLLKRYYMRHELPALGKGRLDFSLLKFHFKNFYHPFVCEFGKVVNNPARGIPALMTRETQFMDSNLRFNERYQPTEWVLEKDLESTFHPKEIVDFAPDGAYSPYNWELFFHAPLLIANELSQNLRFEEARDWYHFIFNPLGVESAMPNASTMSKYWITKPFFETTDPQYIQQRIENILLMLAGDPNAPGHVELESQVRDWRTNPFEPHRIANYRTVAYQKTVVMKYLDNLIAWGDYLFRQDTMESINEATQLYILAAELLGPRPKKIPSRVKPSEQTFNELENELDKFSNATAELENLVPALAGSETSNGEVAPPPSLYFCVPHNEKLLGYWDTISDRLFKIRHCMNIEGVTRRLALFEPPIDPAILVKAVAAGVDIGSALADLNAPLPLYRFQVLLQKANEVCNDLKALSSALLAALEKKDGEALGQLRQAQEIRVLEAVKTVREQQIDEAKENLEAIRRSKAVVEIKRDFYRDIEKISQREQQGLDRQGDAFDHQDLAHDYNFYASLLGYLPNSSVGVSGFGGSPHATLQWGTENIMSALRAFAESESALSGAASSASSSMTTLAGWDRRFDDWKLQEKLAEKELEQIDKSIAAAELRQAIAEKELENHALQIENAKAMDEFMRLKYTNEELFQWQVGQIAGVYFQSYKLAHDLAKRAERGFRFELGLTDSNFIKPGYWDSLKKGLLAGENLQYDLRRLETAYLEQNRREFELTKSISLLLLDPLELVRLRETGRCDINLPEEIFDLDYPGHYFRRIKSVSLTVPCVVGPYTTLSCTLRLTKNSVRISTATASETDYPRHTDGSGAPSDDNRFIENHIPVDAIAASHGQNDSGVFELSFRDERYLPFEGAGVISQWSLELFHVEGDDFGKALRQFDYSTITDAVLHIKYTAREDAGEFKQRAVAHLRRYFGPTEGKTPAVRMLNLRRDFPTQWHQFLHPVNANDSNIFEFELAPNLFPIRDTNNTLTVKTIVLLARSAAAGELKFDLTISTQTPISITLQQGDNRYGNLYFGEAPAPAGVEIVPTAPPAKWKLTPSGDGGLPVAQLEELFLVIGYERKATPA
jgi:hypothetical protein